MSDVVKLSNETVTVLKKLYEINQSVKIVANQKQLKSVNESKTCAMYVDIVEELPRNFCVYDLREFISVLGIIDSPVIDFSNDKFVTIKSEDSKQKLKYMDAAESMITSYFERDFQLASEDVAVSVTTQQLKAVMNASSALNLEYVGFKGDGENILLVAFDRNNGDGNDTNGFSVVIGETSDTFDAFYKADALKVLDGESKFTISKKKISKIENGKIVYWMALDSNSKFG